MGSHSDDDAVSDWEAEALSSESEHEEAKPKVRANNNTKKVDGEEMGSKVKEFKIPAHLSEPAADPAAERQRIKEIEELRDLALSGDIFGVGEPEDTEAVKARSRALLGNLGSKAIIPPTVVVEGTSLEKLTLNRLKEIDELCDTLTPKIAASPAKSNAWMKFLDRLIAACADKMTPDDLKTVERKAAEARKQRTTATNLKATNAKKVDQLGVNLRNYQDELDVYDGVGGNDSSEDDETYENDVEIDPEYADFM